MNKELYYVTSWTDKKGKITTTNVVVYAYSEDDAIARFKQGHPTCAEVNGIHKK